MNTMKKILAMLLVCAMVASCGTAAFADTETKTAVSLDVEDAVALRSWVLTETFAEDGTLNGFPVAEDAVLQIYNTETCEFEEAEMDGSLIDGTFVAMFDTDEDEVCDVIRSVAFADASKVWDETMAWCDGAGLAEPGIDDETGYEVFCQDYVIPYGERLFSGIGIDAWSGTVDFQNQEEITYWSDNDYYNATSNDTLTILTGYKTTLQPTGWTCGLSTTISALEWYGERHGLNAYDLANLRGIDEWEAGTPTETIIRALNTLAEWKIIPQMTYEYSTEGDENLYDPAFIKGHLEAGHPVMVQWNSFGWHWQVIIGYDDMGTEGTNDDVLIMMDPYDTTDQNANGYELESYERLIYGVCSDEEEEYGVPTQYLVFYPEDFTYETVKGDGIAKDTTNVGVFTDDNKMSYGNTAEDIQTYYPDTAYLGDNGLAGAATGGYERSGDVENSPYWKTMDFYNMESTDTLHMLTNFKTLQQSTEWTCGLTSSLMVMNWFDMAENETDVSLATHRQNGEIGATVLEGMMEVFTYMNETYGQDWAWVSTEDLDDPDGEESYIGDYCLQAGTLEDWYGLIPYLLDNGIPVMIGSDEWGGHWQVIIGYDDMGTVERTEDDVIILADAYDTTDHNQDGYVIDGFERLVYGWYSSFEPVYKHNSFIAAFPASSYAEVMEALGK